MKKLILFLFLAVLAVTVPAARAFDKDPWHDVDKTLHNLYPRLDAADAHRDKFGASPQVSDEMAELHAGIRDLTARVKNQYGDPKLARKKADELSDLMFDVETRLHTHMEHEKEHVVVRVSPY